MRRRLLLGLALLLLLLVVALAWPAWEVWRTYADAPAPGDPYRTRSIELAAAAQPEGADGWPELAAVLRSIDSIQEAGLAEWMAGGPDAPMDEAALEASIDAALADGTLLARLEAALVSPRFVRPFDLDGFAMMELLPLTRPARALGRALVRRTEQAVEAGDWPEVERSLALLVRLGEVTGRQPTTIHRLVGNALEDLAYRTLARLLRTHRPPRTVADGLRRRIEAIPPPDVAAWIEHARLHMRAVLHGLFGSRGHVLPLTTLFTAEAGPGGLTTMDVIDPPNDPRSIAGAIRSRFLLAPRDEAMRAADLMYAALAERLERPYRTRWDDWPPAELDDVLLAPRLALVAQLLPSLQGLPDVGVELLLHRRATILFLAIESHVAEHGTPPASLEDLVPDRLASLPVDPTHGGGFGYRPSEDGLGYLLYSFGPDGIDDGGTFPSEPPRSRRDVAPGLDAPIR